MSSLALFPSADTSIRGTVLYLNGIGDHIRRYFSFHSVTVSRYIIVTLISSVNKNDIIANNI